MEEEFVPYSLALELKELGFNEICLTYYNFNGKIERSDDWAFGVDMENKRDRNQCLAPLWQQAFRWFREKYMLSGEIYIFKNFWNFDIEDINNSIQLYTSDITSYSTYEDAEIECLKKLIEIAKEQNVK